ncbi:helix-turn-helix domain-containing protein [uncultured Pleomorphomonas sp.]|nr:helix-turn-helix domain-containing protein [uncultured Pleomorphomonas sp.]
MSDRKKPERILVDDASAILGVPVRTVQALAARGEIPAAKVGRRWTFNPEKLRQWLTDQESKYQRKSTNAAWSGGAVSRLPARNSDEAYERAIGRLGPKHKRDHR